jgi:hypothetical protein
MACVRSSEGGWRTGAHNLRPQDRYGVSAKISGRGRGTTRYPVLSENSIGRSNRPPADSGSIRRRGVREPQAPRAVRKRIAGDSRMNGRHAGVLKMRWSAGSLCALPMLPARLQEHQVGAQTARDLPHLQACGLPANRATIGGDEFLDSTGSRSSRTSASRPSSTRPA